MGYDLYLVAWYFHSWRRKLFHDYSELHLIFFLGRRHASILVEVMH